MLIDFVIVAGLVAIAGAYVRSGEGPTRPGLVWGIVFAAVAFAVPLALNQMLDTDFLHRFHKILAFASAFVVFTAWTAAMKYRSRRHSLRAQRPTADTALPGAEEASRER